MIAHVVALMLSPAGRDGVERHEVGVPLLSVGVIAVIAAFWVSEYGDPAKLIERPFDAELEPEPLPVSFPAVLSFVPEHPIIRNKKATNDIDV